MNLKNNFKLALKGLVELLYPNQCMACEEFAPPKGMITCIKCEAELPLTNYHLDFQNPLTKRFDGKFRLETGTALFHFTKSSRSQELIHKLKYEGKKIIGLKSGEYLGALMLESNYFVEIDTIIPVPMHPRKEHQRGYNQSNVIAEGIAKSTNWDWAKDALKKVAMTESQTRKGRLQRVENVAEVFAVDKKEAFQNKKVLLVDDVLTTGATIESCATLLLENGAKSVSIATIGITKF